jgi:hypothetical protein
VLLVATMNKCEPGMKRNVVSQCTQTQELIRRKGSRKSIKRTSLLSPKYNFPARRQDIQYQTAQRQVEPFRLGVPVKPYGVFPRWHGERAVYHQRKTLVRSNQRRVTEAPLLHSPRGGSMEGMMNMYSHGSLT